MERGVLPSSIKLLIQVEVTLDSCCGCCWSENEDEDGDDDRSVVVVVVRARKVD